MSQASHDSCNVSKTTWYEHERQPATMQFENDKNTLNKSHVRILFFFFFHIMQYEMNVTNRCTTNQRRLQSRRDQKRKAGQGGAVTCGTTTSDLVTTRLSEVFALHAELIGAVWFSADKHLHTNAAVTNLSICPFSHGRKQREDYGNAEGYCYGSCQEFQHQTPSMTSNYSNTGASLAASQCKIT